MAGALSDSQPRTPSCQAHGPKGSLSSVLQAPKLGCFPGSVALMFSLRDAPVTLVLPTPPLA